MLSGMIASLLLLALLNSALAYNQVIFGPHDSRVSSTTWQSIGPFQLGTREGPLLPPLYPDIQRDLHNSPLPDCGLVAWKAVQEDSEGWVEIGNPDIRWNALRATGGWAILQHQIHYRRELFVPTSGFYSFDLTTGAEFSISSLPSTHESRMYYAGNMYTYPNAPPHIIELAEGTYELTVTYHHDIRIVGEPGVDGVPTGRWRLAIEKEKEGVKVEAKRTVMPSIYKGVLMGGIIGVQVTNIADTETYITDARSNDDKIVLSLTSPIRLAPRQTLLIPVNISQSKPLISSNDSAFYGLSFSLITSSISTGTIEVQIFLPSPPPTSPLISSFLSSTLTPSYSLYIPPLICDSAPSHTLLALHGAGTDPATATEWSTSIERREKEWIVYPIGMTEWGTDWHGSSLGDERAAIKRLKELKKVWEKVECGGAITRENDDGKLIVLGHSNGGQGTWYFISHFPDEVLGSVPASAYFKIQDYVPYSFSVGRHYRDSALTGILTSSLTSFDNDLYASNLVGIPILARHGGNDDNVAVQHSREMVSLIDTWSKNGSSASYSEVPGVYHWFDAVFRETIVTDFLTSILEKKQPLPKRNVEFTVTTANPDESSSKNGFKIIELETPGRLARITVHIRDDTHGKSIALIKPSNIKSFSIDSELFRSQLGLSISSIQLSYELEPTLVPATLSYFSINEKSLSASSSLTTRPRRYGPLISILTSAIPIRIIVGTLGDSATTKHLQSIADRIAHDMFLYVKITSEILLDSEYMEEDGNIVLLGDGFTNRIVRKWAKSWPTPVQYLSPEAFSVHDRIFETQGAGLLFLTPKPSDPSALVLVLSGIGWQGLESAARLFPIRTGVPLPDWVVSTSEPNTGGIEAAGFWGSDWSYSEKTSHLGT